MAKIMEYVGARTFPALDSRTVKGRIKTALKQSAKLARKQFDIHGKGYTGGLSVKENIVSDEEIVVGSDDQRFAYVDAGTRAHDITGNPALAFNDAYKAKTSVHSIPTKSGGPSGNSAYAAVVRHPGVTPREIDETIAEKLAPEIVKIFDDILVPYGERG